MGRGFLRRLCSGIWRGRNRGEVNRGGWLVLVEGDNGHMGGCMMIRLFFYGSCVWEGRDLFIIPYEPRLLREYVNSHWFGQLNRIHNLKQFINCSFVQYCLSDLSTGPGQSYPVTPFRTTYNHPPNHLKRMKQFSTRPNRPHGSSIVVKARIITSEIEQASIVLHVKNKKSLQILYALLR